jgi:hypothetical protein
MGLKASLSKQFARAAMVELKIRSSQPVSVQLKQLNDIVKTAAKTAFGKDHGLRDGMSLESFQRAVPVNDYEGLKSYLDRAVAGESNVVWPGKPIYFTKTSGTTSGTKFIPITEESLSNHISGARNALLAQIVGSGNADFVSGKMIFLQGNPELDKTEGGIPLGRLSGIVAHHVPKYLQRSNLPSMETNCIDDWEEKLDAIVKETADQDLRLVSGIPTWVQMYFEKLLKYTGKETVQDVFPNLSLFVHGGCAFGPYSEKFKQLIGFDIDRVELYPASEGFLAFQDKPDVEGMLLNVGDGIFFEFIPMVKYLAGDRTRIMVDKVELGVNYAVIITTNAGLFAYDLGDTVKFVSLDPLRVVVTGRTKHFTSAFGEHVIAEEVESAIEAATEKNGGVISDLHLAPQVKPKKGKPYHEWLIEFAKKPKDLKAFSSDLNQALRDKNTYYNDLQKDGALAPAVVTPLASGTFVNAMKSKGMLGGQNKIPRLANDRTLADLLLKSQK